MIGKELQKHLFKRIDVKTMSLLPQTSFPQFSFYSKLLLKITNYINITLTPFNLACEMVSLRESNHLGKGEETAWWLTDSVLPLFTLQSGRVRDKTDSLCLVNPITG